MYRQRACTLTYPETNHHLPSVTLQDRYFEKYYMLNLAMNQTKNFQCMVSRQI